MLFSSFSFVFFLLLRGPLILQHLLTALARFAAFKTTALSHVTLIVLWGGAQLLRLAVVGAEGAVSPSLYVVGGMIMLDKCGVFHRVFCF